MSPLASAPRLSPPAGHHAGHVNRRAGHRAGHRAALAAVTTVALLAGSRVARAGDDRDALLAELADFTGAVAEAKADGSRAKDRLTRPASECDQVVARLGKTGLKPDQTIDGDEPYPFKQAGERCRDYARWQAAVAAAAVVAETGDALAVTETLTAGKATEEFAVNYGKTAAGCSAAVEQALGKGVPPSLAIRIVSNAGDNTMTLPDARARFCQKLADWAKAFGPATIAAKQAAAEAARVRYASVGAGGDRLSWLTYYDPDGTGTTWFLPGCKEEGAPRKLAKAPVLLRWWTADDGTHTIRRLQFKGNKLVKDTTRSFLTEGAARAGCK